MSFREDFATDRLQKFRRRRLRVAVHLDRRAHAETIVAPDRDEDAARGARDLKARLQDEIVKVPLGKHPVKVLQGLGQAFGSLALPINLPAESVATGLSLLQFVLHFCTCFIGTRHLLLGDAELFAKTLLIGAGVQVLLPGAVEELQYRIRRAVLAWGRRGVHLGNGPRDRGHDAASPRPARRGGVLEA